jgi:hypothetical protein
MAVKTLVELQTFKCNFSILCEMLLKVEPEKIVSVLRISLSSCKEENILDALKSVVPRFIDSDYNGYELSILCLSRGYNEISSHILPLYQKTVSRGDFCDWISSLCFFSNAHTFLKNLEIDKSLECFYEAKMYLDSLAAERNISGFQAKYLNMKIAFAKLVKLIMEDNFGVKNVEELEQMYLDLINTELLDQNSESVIRLQFHVVKSIKRKLQNKKCTFNAGYEFSDYERHLNTLTEITDLIKEACKFENVPFRYFILEDSVTVSIECKPFSSRPNSVLMLRKEQDLKVTINGSLVVKAFSKRILYNLSVLLRIRVGSENALTGEKEIWTEEFYVGDHVFFETEQVIQSETLEPQVLSLDCFLVDQSRKMVLLSTALFHFARK